MGMVIKLLEDLLTEVLKLQAMVRELKKDKP